MQNYRVIRIDEQLYGCEELPEGQPVLCDVTLEDAAGVRITVPFADKSLTDMDINDGDTVAVLPDGALKKL